MAMTETPQIASMQTSDVSSDAPPIAASDPTLGIAGAYNGQFFVPAFLDDDDEGSDEEFDEGVDEGFHVFDGDMFNDFEEADGFLERGQYWSPIFSYDGQFLVPMRFWCDGFARLHESNALSLIPLQGAHTIDDFNNELLEYCFGQASFDDEFVICIEWEGHVFQIEEQRTNSILTNLFSSALEETGEGDFLVGDFMMYRCDEYVFPEFLVLVKAGGSFYRLEDEFRRWSAWLFYTYWSGVNFEVFELCERHADHV